MSAHFTPEEREEIAEDAKYVQEYPFSGGYAKNPSLETGRLASPYGVDRGGTTKTHFKD